MTIETIIKTHKCMHCGVSYTSHEASQQQGKCYSDNNILVKLEIPIILKEEL